MTADLLAKLAPRAPRRLLEELAARGAKAAVTGKDRPLVTVQLATGRDVVGRVVALADEGGVGMLALHVGGPVAAPTVTHVRIDQIVAVTHDVAGDRAPLADAPAPGRLELARVLAERAAAIAARLGGPLAILPHDPLGDDDRRAAMAAVPVLERVLVRLADDELGKVALRALTEIRIGATARGGVRKDGTTLTIELPRSADDAWDDAALRRAVELAL